MVIFQVPKTETRQKSSSESLNLGQKSILTAAFCQKEKKNQFHKPPKLALIHSTIPTNLNQSWVPPPMDFHPHILFNTFNHEPWSDFEPCRKLFLNPPPSNGSAHLEIEVQKAVKFNHTLWVAADGFYKCNISWWYDHSLKNKLISRQASLQI